MDVNAVISGIADLREQTGMTYQDIADASGVPKSTVIRILSGQTQNPSIKSIADIAVAVGYEIDPVKPAVLQDHTKDAYILYLQEALAAEKKMSDKRVAEQRCQDNILIAELRRYRNFRSACIIALVLILVGWLMLDILHPSAGWFQRELARSTDYTPWELGNILLTVRDWIRSI